MSQNVIVTGAGRKSALGYHFVLRYLENGDTVFATVRKEAECLVELQKQYPDKLHILLMNIGSTESVRAAAAACAGIVDHIDLIINNAVTVSTDINKEFEDFNLDLIADVVNVTSVGALRVVQAFLPLLKKSAGVAAIANISSEAGSIGTCYRTVWYDYNMSKAALNMGTMMLHNKFKDEPKLNIFCVHPGWIRTNPDSADAPTDPYDAAETLRLLFEKKREDKDGPVFIDNTGAQYPW